MTTMYDVPAKELIDAVSKKLQNETKMSPPDWSAFVRTSVDRENPPNNPEWWYGRCASILRKIYVQNVIGIERLRQQYGGARDRGSKPNKARSGSGSITRKAVQQLEQAGYVIRVKGKGRMLTSKGRSFMDNTAHEVMKTLQNSYPELKKY